MRLCRCGAIVAEKGLCPKCRPPQPNHKQTTKERGYGNDWRTLSERQRQHRPICEVCEARGKATPATQMHHVEKIRDAPNQRMHVRNILSVCGDCHRLVEPMERLELAQYLADLESGNE